MSEGASEQREAPGGRALAAGVLAAFCGDEAAAIDALLNAASVLLDSYDQTDPPPSHWLG